MDKNFLITIEYDGTNFSGWQRQPDKRTVQGVLEEQLGRFCCQEIALNGTSRTDAGVHALGQCASFHGDFSIPPENLMRAVNHALAGGMNSLNRVGDVRITSIREMPSDFHARFNCKGKTYRYIISNSPNADIFRRNYCYHIAEKLDVDAMQDAAAYIEGTHDFRCFQSSGGNERETTVRTVHRLTVTRNADDEVILEVTGDGFLYNMVRIITGTLVEVGLGKRSPESLERTVESLDRAEAGFTAPPQGLYLKEIYFD